MSDSFVTPWTVTHQGSVHGISQARLMKWVAISLLQRILPTQGSNICLLHLLHWQTSFFNTEPPGEPSWCIPYHPTHFSTYKTSIDKSFQTIDKYFYFWNLPGLGCSWDIWQWLPLDTPGGTLFHVSGGEHWLLHEIQTRQQLTSHMVSPHGQALLRASHLISKTEQKQVSQESLWRWKFKTLALKIIENHFHQLLIIRNKSPKGGELDFSSWKECQRIIRGQVLKPSHYCKQCFLEYGLEIVF